MSQHSLLTILGFTDNLDHRFTIEQHLNPLTNNGVVIHNQ